MKVKISKKRDFFEIIFTAKIVNDLFEFLYSKYSKVAILTDAKVKKLYGEDLSFRLKQKGLDCSVIAFPARDSAKKLDTASGIMELMIEKEFDKDSAIVALGGSTVQNLGGFISASFLHGIDLVQVPTTILAMSNINGKVSLNLDQGNNLVGLYSYPRIVLLNVEYIDTLKKEQLKKGIANFIKFGVFHDKKIFEIVEENMGVLMEKNFALFNEVIEKCLSLQVELNGNDLLFEIKVAFDLDILNEEDFVRIKSLLEKLNVSSDDVKAEVNLVNRIGNISEKRKLSEEELE